MAFSKALAVLSLSFLMIFTASAQEEILDLGCETYTDYILCPQTKVVLNAQIEYTSDVECSEVIGEDYGCIGEAKLLEDIEYEECWIYMPLLPGNEVDYDNYQHNYDCRKHTWKSGTHVSIMTFSDLVTDCTVTEGDEYYEIKTCKTAGTRILANASIDEENGTRYVVVGNSIPAKGFYFEPWHLAVAVIVIIAAWVIYKNKKR